MGCTSSTSGALQGVLLGKGAKKKVTPFIINQFWPCNLHVALFIEPFLEAFFCCFFFLGRVKDTYRTTAKKSCFLGFTPTTMKRALPQKGGKQKEALPLTGPKPDTFFCHPSGGEGKGGEKVKNPPAASPMDPA